jgi:glutamate-1-semialdehyde 2,1-aminomutase
MSDRLRGVERDRLDAFVRAETETFIARHPLSAAAAQQARGFYAGVPMHWMLDWPSPFPLAVAEARGATLCTVDGDLLNDFCLGDTGSMFGHSPEPVLRTLANQAARGFTYMLPTTDAYAVGEILAERFGLPHWQVATTASDANRFALRVARAVTGRSRVLVMNGCYHGAVDETYVGLYDGVPRNRPGLIGQVIDLTEQTRVVEFNDLAALESALADRSVAVVLAEPVMTNCCMVLPDPGYHEALREITRRTGTLLLIDETHTISSGWGGYTRKHGLEPDLFVLGKPIAGGTPASVWGFSDAIAARWDDIRRTKEAGHSGLGTTLSANALAMALMRTTLSEVMTESAYAHMESQAGRLAAGLSETIVRYGLPWHVVRVGARVEFICAPGPLRNGTAAVAAHCGALEAAVHVGLVNRGCLIAPFHNMMLVCPSTGPQQIDQLVHAFDEVLHALAD